MDLEVGQTNFPGDSLSAVVKERFKIRVVKHLVNATASKFMQQQSDADAFDPDERVVKNRVTAHQDTVGAI